MKKEILIIVTVTVIALLVASFLVHNQISELQNQINELKAQNKELQDQNKELEDQISDLRNQLSKMQEVAENVDIKALSVEDWNNPGGLLYIKPFNVTIQNNGTQDVYGVVLSCKITGNQSDLFYNFHYADPLTNTLNVLRGGEKYSMRVYLETSLELISKFSGCRLVVTLTLYDFVLDEWIRVL